MLGAVLFLEGGRSVSQHSNSSSAWVCCQLSAQIPGFSQYFPWEGNLYVWARLRSLRGVIRFWGRIIKVQDLGTSRGASLQLSWVLTWSSPSCLWGTKPLMWSAASKLLLWRWLSPDFQLLEHIKQAFSQCYSALVAIGMSCVCDWQGSQGHLSGDVMSAVRQWKPWLICISQLQSTVMSIASIGAEEKNYLFYLTFFLYQARYNSILYSLFIEVNMNQA